MTALILGWDGPQYAEAREAVAQRIDGLLAIAAVADCRLAVSAPYPISAGHFSFGCMPGNMRFDPMEPIVLTVDWMMLGPGEKPPAARGWTVYERHGEMWQGRSA